MEQTQAPLAWYHAPVFFELSPVDVLVLLVIGVAWSASVWTITESVKRGMRLARPFPRWIVWAPIAGSALATVVAFPIALEGVGQNVEPSPELAVASMFLGSIGGLGAKAAHDRARGLLDAAFTRATSLIGGKQ